ncbi:MAG: hypothetical protein U1F57_00550 [bacterium]
MMKSVQSRLLAAVVLCVALATLAGCGKPRLFGKEMEINPIKKTFPVDAKAAYKATKEALAFYGYNLQKEDDKTTTLETHWQPTTSDSHYVVVFNRPDYGTVGAYHKLVAKITSKGSGESQVEIYSLAKSIISHLESSGVEENKILNKVADFTRKPSIELTNVGLQ